MAESGMFRALEREVHVWIANPDKLLPEKAAERYLPLLSPEEAERFHRFHFDADRLHYLAAHAMLRLCLSRYAPCRPEQWRFTSGSHGKPELSSEGVQPSLSFNLSHTRGMVACIIAIDTPCGIDVESVRSTRDLNGIAQTVFAEEEIAWLNARQADEKVECFYRLWTLKEAYIKAIGLGFSAPVKRIAFDMNGAKPKLRAAADTVPDTNSWQFDLHAPSASHSLAVAVRSSGADRRIVYHEFEWN